MKDIALLRSLRFIYIILMAVLAGCGFHLRGDVSLPYQTIYFALPPNSVLSAKLKLNIKGSTGTEVVGTEKEAEAIFRQVLEKREKLILSVNNLGRAREYQLRFTYVFRLVNSKGTDLLPLNEIVMVRDVSFNDSAVLGKEQEELMLWEDMQQDLIQQVLRRLQAKPKARDEYSE
jgi:LPS-assembly lipoprotein